MHKSARLFHTDVSGDAAPDILIISQVRFRYYAPKVTLSFFQCSDGRYDRQVVVSSEGRVFGGPDIGIRSALGILRIQDTNDNGVPEITFAYQGVQLIEGHPRTYTHTLEWNGDQLLPFVDP